MAQTFYTTRELQDLLQVDRTTIYRMADAGRLPGIKVGHQWRFPRRPVDLWLATSGAAPQPPTAPDPLPLSAAAASGATCGATDLKKALPVECIQLMQDTFADALGVSILMIDMQGQPVTRTSNPCGFFAAIEADPRAHARCLQWWAELSQRLSLQPEFVPSPMGLQCARAYFRAGSEILGAVVMAGVAPEAWPPAPERLAQIAEHLGMASQALEHHVVEVFSPDEQRRQQLLSFAQRLADVVTHIVNERR
jgi:excisionase family DNA binding protein